MAGPLVSIVIPCYNAGRYIAESLQSVLGQTYPDIEVVVVDDGSTDNSAGIVAGFPSVRCIRQENQGVSAARNRGLTETHGAFVVFQDADDILLPRAIDNAVRALDVRPGCGFVYGFSRMIDSQGRVHDGVIHGVPNDGSGRIENASYATLLAGNGVVPAGAACFRRSALEAVGGYKVGLRRAQDHELYLRIAREFPIYCLNEVVVSYRNHSGNTTAGSAAGMLKSVIDITDGQGEWLRKRPELRAAATRGKRHWAKILGPALAGEAIGSLKRGHVEKSLMAFRMLFVHYPQGIMEWISQHI